MNEDKREIKRLKCYWCNKFLSKENALNTVRYPEIFYCEKCYQKGLNIEKEAMGEI